MSLVFIVFLLLIGISRTGGAAPHKAEIIRDKYAIPHIFADSKEAAMYALGWTQAQDDAYWFAVDIISAQGRMAEFFNHAPDAINEELLNSDIRARAMGYHEMAAQWRSLPADIQSQLCAFAAGFNDFIEQSRKDRSFSKRYPVLDGVDRGDALLGLGPITPQDLVAVDLYQNAEGAFGNLTPQEAQTQGQIAFLPSKQGGSNAMAIGPSLVRERAALVYGDLHDPWNGPMRMAHLEVGGKTVFGRFVGPYFAAGRGSQTGIAFTRNRPDTADVFMEMIHPEKQDMYLAGNEWVAMERKTARIKIRNMQDLDATLYYTRHGWLWNYPPGKERPEYGYAIKISTMDTVIDSNAPLKYISERLRAPWLDSVYEHYHLNRSPKFSMRNFVLGDEYGNISYIWAGRVPVRYGDINPLHKPDTGKPLPGWTMLNDWLHGVWRLGDPVFQLPYHLNPLGGVVRSANDAPWFAAGCEANPQRPESIPFHITPESVNSSPRGLLMRELSCSRAITSMDDVRAKLAFSTLSRDSLLFIQAIERGWKMHAANLGEVPLPDDVKKLDRILRQWNAHADVDQPGMTVMFVLRRYSSLSWFPRDYTPTLREMVIYLDELDTVARDMRANYGGLEIPWGDAHFMTLAGRRFPLPGGTIGIQTLFMASMGAFPQPGQEHIDEAYGDSSPSNGATPGLKGRVDCNFGSAFIHAHVMDPRNPVSYAITPHGQIDSKVFPDSPHAFQQAELFASKQWMTVPLTRKDVERDIDPWGGDPGHEHPARTALSMDPKDLSARFAEKR
jgi:acyl-homoserine lactone acylase PvdQ